MENVIKQLQDQLTETTKEIAKFEEGDYYDHEDYHHAVGYADGLQFAINQIKAKR